MKPLLTLQTYLTIRKMDFAQLSAFLQNFYENAFKDGQGDGLEEREVREALLQVKGIGEKRVDAIMEALAEKMKIEKTMQYVCGECGYDLTLHKEAKECPNCKADLYWE